jgi:ubiquinone/menaquinone biosynthesis C-methylase UbiE
MASRYDDELWELAPVRDHPPQERADWIASLEPARHALDLGCGDGAVAACIRADRLTLADVSEVALSRAGARLPDAEIAELDPDAPLPFANGAFDLVVCAETLEHVRDLQLLLSEARRVLEPRGRLAVTTPAHRGLIRAPDPLSPHLRFLTKRSLRGLLGSMGFDVREIRRRGGGLFALASR